MTPVPVPGWVEWGLRPVTYWGLAAVALVASFAWGSSTAIGMALGLIGASFCVWGLALFCQVLGTLSGGPSLGSRTGLAFFVVLSKYPVLFGAWMLTQSLGKSAENGFIAAVLLVYSSAVGWAQAKQASSALPR